MIDPYVLTLTLTVVALAFGLVAAWDVWLWYGDSGVTVTGALRYVLREYPYVLLLLGILIGHVLG